MVTWDSLKDKEIIVYGTGVNAAKCVYLLEINGIKIDYILDGREESVNSRITQYICHLMSGWMESIL